MSVVLAFSVLEQWKFVLALNLFLTSRHVWTRTGRPVTLSVGGHVRVPRTYRGADIFYWLDAIGQLDERWDEADDLVRSAQEFLDLVRGHLGLPRRSDAIRLTPTA